MSIPNYVRSGPYADGARAYHRGLDISACPYRQGSEDCFKWCDGYQEQQYYGGWGDYTLFKTKETEMLVQKDYAPRQPRKQPLSTAWLSTFIKTILCALVIGYAGAHYFYPQYF